MQLIVFTGLVLVLIFGATQRKSKPPSSAPTPKKSSSSQHRAAPQSSDVCADESTVTWEILRGRIKLDQLVQFLAQPRREYKKLSDTGIAGRDALQQMDLPKYHGQIVLKKQSLSESKQTCEILAMDLNIEVESIIEYLEFTAHINSSHLGPITNYLAQHLQGKSEYVGHEEPPPPPDLLKLLKQHHLIVESSALSDELKIKAIKTGKLSKVYKAVFKTAKGSRTRKILEEKILSSNAAMSNLASEMMNEKFIYVSVPTVFNWDQINNLEMQAAKISNYLVRPVFGPQ